MEGKEWDEPITVELMGKKGNELTLRVGESIVKSFIYVDEMKKSHVFPVTSTEQFNGRSWREMLI